MRGFNKKTFIIVFAAYTIASLISLQVSTTTPNISETAESIAYSEKSKVKAEYTLMGLVRGVVIGLAVGFALSTTRWSMGDKAALIVFSLIFISLSLSFYQAFRAKDMGKFSDAKKVNSVLMWSGFYGLILMFFYTLLIDLDFKDAFRFMAISAVISGLGGLIAWFIPASPTVSDIIRYVFWAASAGVAFAIIPMDLRPLNYKLIFLPALGFGIGREVTDLFIYKILENIPFMPDGLLRFIFKTNLNFRLFITTPDFIIYALSIGAVGGFALYLIVPWRQKRIIAYCAIGFLAGLMIQYYGRYLAYTNQSILFEVIADLSFGLIIGSFVAGAVKLKGRETGFLMLISAIGFYFIRFLFKMKYPIVFFFWDTQALNNFFLYGFGGLSVGYALNTLILEEIKKSQIEETQEALEGYDFKE